MIILIRDNICCLHRKTLDISASRVLFVNPILVLWQKLPIIAVNSSVLPAHRPSHKPLDGLSEERELESSLMSSVDNLIESELPGGLDNCTL